MVSHKTYESLLESVVCNLCGADDFVIVYPARYDQARPEELHRSFRSSGDEILVDRLVRCRKCGLQYLNPRLREDVVIDAYSQGSDEIFVSQAKARERTFAGSLKLLEKIKPSKGKLLDVGTAGGSFLHVAQQRGWDVSGCEPNRWLTQWAQENYGLNIFPGTIFDMKLPDDSFDVVCLWDVLEHTADPRKVLGECRRVLKQGGLLLVNYPDIGSLVSRLMGRKWVFLLSVHLYYFTLPTIKKMLQACGFRMVRSQQHWQSLELDYIMFRMRAYIPAVADAGRKIVKKLKLENVSVPYWMGQSLVIAEKS